MVLILSALKVVTAKNPVHAVLFLVLAFVTSSCLWMMLNAEFLALILIVVYVGAVMVLFLFVVMMLDIANRFENAPNSEIVTAVANYYAGLAKPERYDWFIEKMAGMKPADTYNFLQVFGKYLIKSNSDIQRKAALFFSCF